MFTRKPVPQRRLSARLWLPAAALIACAAMVIFYNSNPPGYALLMKVFVKVPAPHPFTDLESVSSSIRCWANGVNVYLNNSCYTVWPNQVFNYSPLWLRARFLAVSDSWLNFAGVVLMALFAATLALLPPPRSARARLAATLLVLSPGLCLGIERANFDMLMFILVAIGLAMRRLPLPFRLAGYGIILLAGLLKFYPLVALVVVVRERFTVLAAVCAASIAALAALIVAYHTELGWMLQGLPEPSFYTLQFGARDLPSGLGALAARLLQAKGSTGADALEGAGLQVSRMTLVVFTMMSAAAAILIGRRANLTSALSRLPPRTLDCLGAGATLIAACFFEGQSVLYRGMFLLFALPGLVALRRQYPIGAARVLLTSTCILIIFVLWNPFIETMLFVAGLTPQIPYKANVLAWLPTTPAGGLLWLTTELGWWLIVTVLLAIAGAFILRAEAWADAATLLRRRARFETPPASPNMQHGS